MNNRFEREKQKKMLVTCAVSVAAMALGIFMVENLSKRESPPLGQVFNVIVGFLLIAVSAIVLFVTIKQHFFPKKKKKKSRPVFLDENLVNKDKKAAGQG
ncbi:hypothetical protein [Flavobacterium caeni]|uniref:Uncharacterized protein n=1 Tax=Flavobacterium caeni TaxID=490189 RepID=A0A1G5BBM9_9FLAO|nr:hypothetical protein [Flavobacterium caeni]SCX87561.1 hypothetical protein SAMN02927903_00319 [Flavobacterium caeni]